MTLAALDATLTLHRDGRERIPIYRMLAATLDELRARASEYLSAIPGAAMVESSGYLGGGTLPGQEIASIAVALAADADGLAAALRHGDPPIVPRIEAGRVLLDLRTIAPGEDEIVIAAVRTLTLFPR